MCVVYVPVVSLNTFFEFVHYSGWEDGRGWREQAAVVGGSFVEEKNNTI
jgi:hypothetical protein